MKEKLRSKPCLLIVDDGSIRALLGKTLETRYELVCLPNGKDVVAQIVKTSPRLLILDVKKQASLGICKKVRAHARNQKLPILLITTRADKGEPLPQLRRCIDYLLTQEMK